MRRTYKEILNEHYKYYPKWFTYKTVNADGTTTWKAKAPDEKNAREFKNLTQLERTLDSYHRYSQDYTQELRSESV